MKVSILVILVTIYLQNSVTAQEAVVCAYGYKYNGTKCVASTDNSLQTQQPCSACPNKCQAGYVLRDGLCYPTTCPDGSPVVDNKCITSITTCVAPYSLENGKCVKISYGDLICQDGYHFQNGKCQSIHQERPICKFGYTYDNDLKKCQQIVQKQCPIDSSIAADGSCTSTEVTTIQCQPGYQLEGNTCVFKTKQECIGGVWENGNCVIIMKNQPIVTCSYGFVEINGECQKKTSPSTVCPEGSYYDGTQCKLQESLTCPSDYSLRGNRCFKSEEIAAHCPTGYNNDGQFCVKYTPATSFCENGLLVNNYCVITIQAEISCPYGFTLDSFTNTCIKTIIVPVQCYGGATLIGEYCVITVQPKCPHDFIIFGDVCQKTKIVQPICASPSIASGNSCVITVDPTCPTDYNLDNGVCVIYSIKAPTCEPGYYLENWQCIKKEETNPVCPDRYILDVVKKVCYFVPGPVIVGPGGNTTCTGCGCSRGGSGCSNTNTNTITISNIVNNNNTVSVPTNIHSTNINNISVPKPVERIEKEEIKEKQEEKCCVINTPRQCVQESGRWNCQHKKYSRCGSFCRQPQMFLRPVETVYRDNMLVMPPPPRRLPSRHYGQLDCSGCIYGGYNCSPQCYSYGCNNRRCGFENQNSFCGTYGGQGCDVSDGCFADSGCERKTDEPQAELESEVIDENDIEQEE